MELESKDCLGVGVVLSLSFSVSPSIGEGLLWAENKEYLNNVNYHNTNAPQSPFLFFFKVMLCSDMDLNECVFVWSGVIVGHTLTVSLDIY